MKLFKYLAVLMMAMVCIGVSSCGNDDDENKDSKNPLIGTWVEETTKETVTFNADGTGVSVFVDGKDVYTDTFTYKFDSSTMILTAVYKKSPTEENKEVSKKIELNGNVLKIDDQVFHKK